MFAQMRVCMDYCTEPATGSKQPARPNRRRSPPTELIGGGLYGPAPAGPDTLLGKDARAPPARLAPGSGSNRLAVNRGFLAGHPPSRARSRQKGPSLLPVITSRLR